VPAERRALAAGRADQVVDERGVGGQLVGVAGAARAGERNGGERSQQKSGHLHGPSLVWSSKEGWVAII